MGWDVLAHSGFDYVHSELAFSKVCDLPPLSDHKIRCKHDDAVLLSATNANCDTYMEIDCHREVGNGIICEMCVN